MASFVTAIPAVVGRSVLAPLNVLPKSFANTHILYGQAEADSASPTDLQSPSGPSSSLPSPPLFTQQPIADLVKATPSVHAYYPHPLLPLGSFQTIYSAFANTVEVDVVHYKRHVFLLPDGGTIAADVSPPEWDEDQSPEGQQRKTIVLSHGLTGGSHESYVRHVIPPLIAAGYRCVVINFRGCGQTPVTSAQMYSAAKTDDLRCGLLWVLSRWKQTEIALMGFSLGANVVGKYLGEEGDDTPVKGGVILATPFDLKIGSDELAKSALYDKAMAANLTKKLGVHSPTLGLEPTLHEPLRKLLDHKGFTERNPDEVKQRKVKVGSLKWVDDSATRMIGGHSHPYGPFPFATADDYYRANGAVNVIHQVARPLLLLNSDDDPIVPAPILEKTKTAMAKNPNVAFAITRGGGHLGWWSAKGIRGAVKPSRWLGQVTREWVDQLFAAHPVEAFADYRQRRNPWADGEVKTIEGVEYELLSEDELLPFEVQQTQSASGETSSSLGDQLKAELPAPVAASVGQDLADAEPSVVANGKDDSAAAATEQGPRHAWLKTQLLEYNLIHPSHSPAWKGVQYQHEQETRSGTMYMSTKHPQIGYLELPSDSRVAGCGEEFQGGKSIPGQTSNTKGERLEAGGAGEKKKQAKGFREEGTIAGL